VDINTSSPESGGLVETADTNVKTWEFPLVLKRRMTDAPTSVFLAGGGIFRYASTVGHIYGIKNTGLCCREITTHVDSVETSYNLRARNTLGATVGLGTTLTTHHVHFVPEIRYTYWPNRAVAGEFEFASRGNQVDVLVGLTFGAN
jgi:hypothetical protein